MRFLKFISTCLMVCTLSITLGNQQAICSSQEGDSGASPLLGLPRDALFMVIDLCPKFHPVRQTCKELREKVDARKQVLFLTHPTHPKNGNLVLSEIEGFENTEYKEQPEKYLNCLSSLLASVKPFAISCYLAAFSPFEQQCVLSSSSLKSIRATCPYAMAISSWAS